MSTWCTRRTAVLTGSSIRPSVLSTSLLAAEGIVCKTGLVNGSSFHSAALNSIPGSVDEYLVHPAHGRADRVQHEAKRLIHHSAQTHLGGHQVPLVAVRLPHHLHAVDL